MYHTKFKEPLYTSNTCIFHYLYSYTWHTNESITSSHRSASKSPNTQCKVPTNQESNSLAPRNHIQKLKITDFYRFTGDFLKKSLTDLPADFWPISAGFHPPPLISWAANPPSRTPLDSWPNPTAFHPATTVFFGRWPAIAPLLVYRLSRWLPSDSGRFLLRRRRFWPSQTGFAFSLDRTEWGTKNPLFCWVGETEYHIHE
jgi:hypothetical protein